MALQLRQGCVTDLLAIYRGEESYIRCWEPDHEAAWCSQLERHRSL
jgi:ribosomal-protein-alanine N-acetyltransferase